MLRRCLRTFLADALDGFRGEWNELSVRSIFLRDEQDNYYPAADGSQVGAFEERRDFEIWINRDAPGDTEQPLRRA